METLIHRTRRDALLKDVGDALVLIPGAGPLPINIPMNFAPFRQGSHLLYLTGLRDEGGALLGDPATGRWELFVPLPPEGDEIWHGATPTPEARADALGVDAVLDLAQLEGRVADLRKGRTLLATPALDVGWHLRLKALGAEDAALQGQVRRDDPSPLLRALVKMRMAKSPREVEEMTRVGALSADVHRTLMAATRPGVRESQLRALTEGMFAAAGCRPAYNPIITRRGEILHARAGEAELKDGDLLLVDIGAESPEGYAADITRTYPVNGRFSPRQRDIYEIVLECQRRAVEACTPGMEYRDLHLKASLWLAEGLKALKILKGSPEDCVAADAHALFFPHGLGHLLGLDVHDLEDIGDLAGYDTGRPRSERFGLAWLRMDRPLTPGMVVTIEPGIYFIPGLLQDPEVEARHRAHVDFDRARSYLGLGGVRIEDDILITEGAPFNLSEAAPKDIETLEALVGSQPDALGAVRRIAPLMPPSRS